MEPHRRYNIFRQPSEVHVFHVRRNSTIIGDDVAALISSRLASHPADRVIAVVPEFVAPFGASRTMEVEQVAVIFMSGEVIP